MIPYMTREQYIRLYTSGLLWKTYPDAKGNYLDDVEQEQTLSEVIRSTLIDLNHGGSTPSQYALPESAEELQDLIEYRGMNFAIGNIFKACYRLGHCEHSDTLRDLRKMKWFVERELTRVEKEGE